MGEVRHMNRSFARIAMWTLALVVGWNTGANAQAADRTYKLGMFEQNGRHFAGLVIDDKDVIDLAAAGRTYPSTLRGLIEAWDPQLANQLGDLAAASREKRPADAMALTQLRTLPPLEDPDVLLMAARNYVEHAEEMNNVGRTYGSNPVIDESVTVGLPAIWTREAGDQRPNPYLFPKLKSAITGFGDAILLPPGRSRIDFECELLAVIGRKTQRVSIADALDYVFGYTIMVDVSDRENRPDGRYGSDWFIGKSHDTFAPMGPFVVPAEFVGDPQDLDVRYTLNDTVMQDSNTALMIHTVRDLVSFASHIITLGPGDLISSGTPGGVGEGRTPPVYLRDGDTSNCWIEHIGTLSNPVRASP